MSRDLWERVWEKVDRSGDCWVWTGAKDGLGYGQVWDPAYGRHRKATRVVWELTRGTPPDEMGVLHRCDNPPCVRPTHLFVGTHADNMRDASLKGRIRPGVTPRGEAHHNAVLTDAQVADIRRRYAAGESRTELAREHGTSFQTIWRIGTGRGRSAA